MGSSDCEASDMLPASEWQIQSGETKDACSHRPRLHLHHGPCIYSGLVFVIISLKCEMQISELKHQNHPAQTSCETHHIPLPSSSGKLLGLGASGLPETSARCGEARMVQVTSWEPVAWELIPSLGRG